MIRVSFDIGGVMSKYPEIFRPFIAALQGTTQVDVFVLTDMHDVEESYEMLQKNGFFFHRNRIINSDFETYGEACKAVALKENNIDMHFD